MLPRSLTETVSRRNSLYVKVTVSPSVPLGAVLGYQRRIDVASPAAATDWSRAVPGEGEWMVLGFRAQLVTGAGAGGRSIRVSITDGTAEVIALAATGLVPAATTIVVGGGVKADPGAVGSTAIQASVGLPELILQVGWTFGVVTNNLQGTDQWSGIRLLVLELPEGPKGYPKGPAFMGEE